MCHDLASLYGIKAWGWVRVCQDQHGQHVSSALGVKRLIKVGFYGVDRKAVHTEQSRQNANVAPRIFIGAPRMFIGIKVSVVRVDICVLA